MEKHDHISSIVRQMDEKTAKIFHISSQFRIPLEYEKLDRVMELVFLGLAPPMLRRSEKPIKKSYSTI